LVSNTVLGYKHVLSQRRFASFEHKGRSFLGGKQVEQLRMLPKCGGESDAQILLGRCQLSV
jgi:hypothetical protein